jgi:hypothetical protein
MKKYPNIMAYTTCLSKTPIKKVQCKYPSKMSPIGSQFENFGYDDLIFIPSKTPLCPIVSKKGSQSESQVRWKTIL